MSNKTRNNTLPPHEGKKVMGWQYIWFHNIMVDAFIVLHLRCLKQDDYGYFKKVKIKANKK